MPFFPSRVRRVATVACLAIGLGVTTAHAGLVDPGLEIDWWVNGAYVGQLLPEGVYDENAGWWTYQGLATDAVSGVSLDFNVNGDPDPILDATLIVSNPFLPVADITLVVTLPIAPTIPIGSVMQGSATVMLTTDAGGGSLSTFGGNPLWQGHIDGSPVGNSASMFFDPFALSNEGGGSTGSSQNFGPLPGPPVLDSIGIEINLSLTQLDQARIGSVFIVTPAPGVVGLLAIGALGTRRRRRRLAGRS